MTSQSPHDMPKEWSELWTRPDDEAPAPQDVQDKLRARRHRQRWRDRLELVAVCLGVVFTIGLLFPWPPPVSIAALCVFCWAVWGASTWTKWRVASSEKRALALSPGEFVQTLRRRKENRRRMIRWGRYMLVAVGVFCAVWTSWFISDNWAVYQQEPWRAVVGVGGVIFFYTLAIFLHRRERRRLEEELEGIAHLERDLAADDPQLSGAAHA